jgi:ribonucleoside-diphosphate reductase subunit M2
MAQSCLEFSGKKLSTIITQMKITIYSKEGCEYCDHTVSLCESEGVEYEKVMIEKEELKKLCGGRLDSYPQIFIDERRIGNFFEFQEWVEQEYEPILFPTLSRRLK